ncbi:hypothetical protein Kfla_1548 [Kribbella flavida DSM 17836]|uniref:Polyketide cyclase/dehydrase n=1 Tax=Kribbella flavida (strain DSM 17836 / JCM 10339 / NBRC 14399) TaxID=479435 RepID=D2PLL7_KRIFD|nr:hypothetical protein [Kribbella flavida]ADB30646.1 hypothetical protein Kfla_1548 [Kribbella flavida DSM 17836]
MPATSDAVIRTRNEVVVGRDPDATYFFLTMPRNVLRTHPLVVHLTGVTDRCAVAGDQVTQVLAGGDEMFSASWTVTRAEWGRRWTVRTDRYGWRGVGAEVDYVFEPVAEGTRLTREMTLRLSPGHQECGPLLRQLGDRSVPDRFLRNVKTRVEAVRGAFSF